MPTANPSERAHEAPQEVHGTHVPASGTCLDTSATRFGPSGMRIRPGTTRSRAMAALEVLALLLLSVVSLPFLLSCDRGPLANDYGNIFLTPLCWLVLAETCAIYPGWRASVDGVETPLFVANGAATALPLPAGAREVVLTFTPPGLRAGMSVSAAGVALSVLALWWLRPRGGAS